MSAEVCLIILQLQYHQLIHLTHASLGDSRQVISVGFRGFRQNVEQLSSSNPALPAGPAPFITDFDYPSAQSYEEPYFPLYY